MKQLKITVNGKSYDVQVEEVTTFASAPVQTPAAAPATASVSVAPPVPTTTTPAPTIAPVVPADGTPVNAPMPGTVNKIPVTAGQAVKKGDVLIVLEAMKMENDICADKDGIVGGIMVVAGEVVGSGKLLLTLK